MMMITIIALKLLAAGAMQAYAGAIPFNLTAIPGSVLPVLGRRLLAPSFTGMAELVVATLLGVILNLDLRPNAARRRQRAAARAERGVTAEQDCAPGGVPCCTVPSAA